MSFNNVAIVKGSAYRIYFWYVIAIRIMNGSNFVDKMGVLSNFIFIMYKK